MTITNTDDFLSFLFGEEKGYVYAPLKLPSGEFRQYWWKWPEQGSVLEEYILTESERGDVYLSPVLFNSEDTQDFQLSRVVWCDFDNGIPDELGDFPKPGVQVLSSNRAEKQHWYWRSTAPITDSGRLERANRQLAYLLGADKGCWNFGRVLRPIHTLNHKYDPPAPVSLASTSEDTISEYVLASLPDVPLRDRSGFDYQLLHLGAVIKKYPFSPEAWDFFTLPKKDGERHLALTSIAMTCVEKGMTRDEAMTMLYDADDRWKKYVGRKDRSIRLRSILQYAERNAKAGSARKEPELPSLPRDVGDRKADSFDSARPQKFSSFVGHQFQVDWVIDGLIHQQGLGIVAAPPGIGKTQFSLNLALSIASGHPFLNWKINRPRRVLFLSLEMMQPELKFYLDKMKEDFTQAEREQFDANCYFLARQAFRLNSETNQRLLLEWIDDIQPEGIFIDSLSRCTGGDLEKGEIDQVFDFLNKEVRDKRKCFIWFVHHNRKANFNQKQPKKLEDLYGSQYIGAYASTVVGLWKITNQELEVNCLKIWLSKPFTSFLMERSTNLTFTARKTLQIE